MGDVIGMQGWLGNRLAGLRNRFDDSNPEGVNQYTGGGHTEKTSSATEKAETASVAAKNGGTSEKMAAMNAHKSAAEAHGNAKAAAGASGPLHNFHTKQQAHHEHEAAKLKKSLFGK